MFEILRQFTAQTRSHSRSSPTFSSFSQAEEENGQSRIYLGIHWSFDKTQGIAQGREIARYVLTHSDRWP